MQDELFCTCSANTEGVLRISADVVYGGCVFAHPPDAPVIKARRPFISLLTDIIFIEGLREGERVKKYEKIVNIR